MEDLWIVSEEVFDPQKMHHKETVFTIGNGYLCTRGAFEEGYPGDHRATFLHGVFDASPLVFTELANAPDWLPFTVWLNGERFSLASGTLHAFHRSLDLRTGVLKRTVHWSSPSDYTATLQFERFASLADPHTLLIRCQVTPEFEGQLEFRAWLNGNMDNLGLAHWQWVTQGREGQAFYLLNRTRSSRIEQASAMRLTGVAGESLSEETWDVENQPTVVLKMTAIPGQATIVDKVVAVYTTREADHPVEAALEGVNHVVHWPTALEAHKAAWAAEWERTDVVIEGDEEAQIAVRFNLFQLLIAAPRLDDRVNIGAKTLSGFGYRGHAFWDTEIFMLPLFIYTAPHIAKKLLNYRFRNLPGARLKAQANGCEGAQFPWESADTGEEVTPTWLPHFADRTKLVRIWTGDIEIHISADIALAAYQYWKVTGDDAWMVDQGAELILDTAKFWASRAEWDAQAGRYEYTDVIGPDEYHDHVDNNTFTNRMAQWNLQTALEILAWLAEHAPQKAADLTGQLDLSEKRLAHWREVIDKICLPAGPQGVIQQFEGYFQRKYVDLAALEPRSRSIQEIFGIEGAAETQVLKQPDVLMLMYLLRQDYTDEIVRMNYDYYTPRTDHTYGSSLGPSIQAIMACQVGKPDEAYEHFIRAARADLRDVRSNAGDGIHGASAGGTWQAVVFGFGGLRFTSEGWTASPRLPAGWRRLSFCFFQCGQFQKVDLRQPPAGEVRAFIFDLDGVLTDTAEFHYQGWKRLADEEGLPFTRQDNEALRGISRRESLNLLLKGRPISDEQAEEWMERKNNYYRELLKQMTIADLLPGSRDLLAELRRAGIKVAIASASKNAGEVIDRLELRGAIDLLCDGSIVEHAKPAPDLFLATAERLGIPPQQCVVVEDAEAGVEAAIAARMHSVGLGPVKRVGQADLVLPSLENAHLDRILEGLNKTKEPRRPT